jgi:anaerobic magnesium-protoporphyrin IX monomethyl ester cyclase
MEWVPLGAAYISAALKEKKYPVDILDFDSKRGPKFEDTKDFDVSNYDIIGFSVKAGKSLSFHLYHIDRVKSIPKKTVIVGGPLVTAMPERFLRETKADYVILGEGEETIIKLLDVISKKRDIKKLKLIPGLGFRCKGEVIINPPVMICDLDKLPIPDYASFDMEKYLGTSLEFGERNINMFTSRGCPFNCQFCSHSFGRKWRGQSAKRIIKELKYLIKKYKIRSVYFQDDNFMFSRDRVLEFCRLVKPLHIWWICEGRANNIKEEVVRAMKDAGCAFIRMGLESGSERMLKIMNKGHTLRHSREAIEVFRKLGMPVRAGFMIGMPKETLADSKKTLTFMKEIYRKSPGAHLWTYYYTPRPNTPWYKLAVEKGMRDYTLQDWSKLDKFEKGFFNLSHMTERQKSYMILRTGILSLVYGKGVLKEYILSKIIRIKRRIYQRV